MNALAIAWLDLKRLMREREALGWIFIGPVVFTVFFGMLFKPQPERQTTVAIVNRDADDRVARALGVLLEQDRITVASAPAVEAGRWSVEIPAGAASLFAAAKPMKLTLHARDEESTEERNVRFKVQKALTLLYLHGDANLSAESIAALPARLASAEVIALRPGRHRRPAPPDDRGLSAKRAVLPRDVRVPERAGLRRDDRRGSRDRPHAASLHRPHPKARHRARASCSAGSRSAGFRRDTCWRWASSSSASAGRSTAGCSSGS